MPDYLRISVTDKCNLRCIYCNPFGNKGLLSRRDILSFEEIGRVVRLFARKGIRKVRVTGGEPLVRKNITCLLNVLAGIKGIEDLSLTTNGVKLEEMAEDLKKAGLMRVNISLDSITEETFKRITGYNYLKQVLKGIERALQFGLTPLRINTIILKGINDDEVEDLACLSAWLPLSVRFIEYTPTNKRLRGFLNNFVCNEEIRSRLEKRFGRLVPAPDFPAPGPAKYFRVRGFLGNLGFISGRTEPFCNSCNRLRLSCEGRIYPCLFSPGSYPVQELLRRGAPDWFISHKIEEIMERKLTARGDRLPEPELWMQSIGG